MDVNKLCRCRDSFISNQTTYFGWSAALLLLYTGIGSVCTLLHMPSCLAPMSLTCYRLVISQGPVSGTTAYAYLIFLSSVPCLFVLFVDGELVVRCVMPLSVTECGNLAQPFLLWNGNL